MALHILLAQKNPTVGDLTGNTQRIAGIWKSAPNAVDLVVFPELCVCGYPPEDLIHNRDFLQNVLEQIEYLKETSKSYKSAALIGAPWMDGDQTYNAALLIEGGEIKAVQGKHILPNYGVFDEKRIFNPAPLPDIIPFRGHKLGVMICEDIWTPEVSAHLKKQGAEQLISINASPFDTQNIEARFDMARKRVLETNLPLAYVNQVGGQDELVFDGHSFVMDKDGNIKTLLPAFEDGTHEYSANAMGNTNISFPKSDETLIYKALVTGLHDYVQKNNFPGVLLGLSGGIDSALATVIATEALGADRVQAVMMPSRFTSQDSLEDAAALAKNLDIHLDTIEIEKPVSAFHDILGEHFDENTPTVTYENIQPRARGMILMALSNANGNMVLSTGNKSEIATGYATLYGDMCGGFNPIKDLYKTQLYALCEWINREREIIPQRILTKAPTAELKDNQTDQDSLPPYDILDGILRGLIEENLSLCALTKRGYEQETVRRVAGMLRSAEYKRRQSAPGTKITPRAFGRERRYPITNKFS